MPVSISPAGNGICQLVTIEEYSQIIGGSAGFIERTPDDWRECRYDAGVTGPLLRVASKQIDPPTFEATSDEYVAERAGFEPGLIEPYPLGDAGFVHTIEADGGTVSIIVFLVGTTFVGLTLAVIGGDPAEVRTANEQIAAIAAGRV